MGSKLILGIYVSIPNKTTNQTLSFNTNWNKLSNKKLTFGRTYSATSNFASPFEPFGPLVHKVFIKYTKIWNILISKQYFAYLNVIVQMPSSGSWRIIEKKTFNTGTIRLGCLSCIFQKVKSKRSFPPPFQECALFQGSPAQAPASSSPWSSPRLDSANRKNFNYAHIFQVQSRIRFKFRNPFSLPQSRTPLSHPF